MGIFNLRTYLIRSGLKGVRTIHIRELHSKCIALDMSNILYKIKRRLIDTHSTDPTDLQLELINLIHKFTINNIRIIGVFDGKPNQTKDKTINARKKIREKAKKQLEFFDVTFEQDTKYTELSSTPNESEFSLTDIDSTEDNAYAIRTKIDLSKKATRIKFNDVQKCKMLFDLLGIPYIHVKDMEADLVFKYLKDYNIATHFYTNDTDAIALGCNMLFDLNYSTDFIKLFDYKQIIEELDLTSELMMELCICCGTDFNSGIRNITIDELITLFQKYGCLNQIMENGAIPVSNFPRDFNYDNAFEFFNIEIPVEICTNFTHYEMINPTDTFIKTNFEKIKNDITFVYSNFISSLADTKKKVKFSRKLSEFTQYRYKIKLEF